MTVDSLGTIGCSKRYFLLYLKCIYFLLIGIMQRKLIKSFRLMYLFLLVVAVSCVSFLMKGKNQGGKTFTLDSAGFSLALPSALADTPTGGDGNTGDGDGGGDGDGDGGGDSGCGDSGC